MGTRHRRLRSIVARVLAGSSALFLVACSAVVAGELSSKGRTQNEDVPHAGGRSADGGNAGNEDGGNGGAGGLSINVGGSAGGGEPCAPSCEEGSLCADGSDCASGYCDRSGRCGLCAEHGDCLDVQHCADGGVCADDKLDGEPCLEDLECIAKSCDEGVCGIDE